MKFKRTILLAVIWILSVALATVAVGADSSFMERYYSALEASIADGDTQRLGEFIDEKSEFGLDLFSWVSRLNRLGVSGEFDNLVVEDGVERGGKVRLKVSDRLTLSYPDERVRVFDYRREYVVEKGKIIGEAFEYDRLFPELSAKKTPLERMESSVTSIPSVPREVSKPSLPSSLPVISFLPSQEGKDLKILARWDNPLDMAVELVGKVMDEEELKSMMDQVPPLAEGAVSLVAVKDGLPEIYGVIRPVHDIDPSDALRVVVAQISEETGENLVLKPFDGNLKSELDPLAIVEISGGAPNLYVALWKGDGRTVLISLSEQGLNAMIDSASGKISSLDDKTHLGDSPSLHLKGWMSNDFLRPLVADEDIPLYSSDPLSLEIAFFRLENEVTGRWFSNGVDLFLDPAIDVPMTPVGDDIPFLGGRVLGFMAARMGRIDSGVFRKAMEAEMPGENLDVALSQMTELTGLTMEDILDLLGGRISLVIGGRSRSPIGDVPGAFIQMEPDKKEVLAKVAEALPKIYSLAPAVGLRERKIPGWNLAYAMNAMASATVAVGNDRILFGALDYEKVNEPASLPDNLKDLAKGEDLAVIAFSLVDVREVVKDIADMNSIFLQTDEIKDGMANFLESTAHLDSLVIRIQSLKEGSLSVRTLD